MSTTRQVWLLIQQGEFAFFIDLKDADLHIHTVKLHDQFLKFVWQHKPYQWT